MDRLCNKLVFFHYGQSLSLLWINTLTYYRIRALYEPVMFKQGTLTEGKGSVR
jgi:hypothetical protein